MRWCIRPVLESPAGHCRGPGAQSHLFADRHLPHGGGHHRRGGAARCWRWAASWTRSAAWTTSAGPASSTTRCKIPTEATRPPNWCGPTGRCGISAWPTAFRFFPEKTACTWTAIFPGASESGTRYRACPPCSSRPPVWLPDVRKCLTMEAKVAGDLVYVLGAPEMNWAAPSTTIFSDTWG